MDDKFDPILMVDNEYENISDLEEVIERAANLAFPESGEFTQYTESPVEAMEHLKDIIQLGKRYSAIISDNHFYEGICGDDFIRLIQGQLGYCHSKDERHIHLQLKNFRDFKQIIKCTGRENKEITEFLDEHFRNFSEYRKFVDYHFGNPETSPKLILYCGNINEADTTGFYGVSVVQKSRSELYREYRGGNHNLSEETVLDILKGEGIFTPEQIFPVLIKHPRISPTLPENERIYNPISSHIRKRKKVAVKKAHYNLGRILKKKARRKKQH
ncbi:hypothetical protein FJZ18_00470 [Candidatus Pacearchaeota archaeon]|nr:hypothetical protein [Candidatus Pacearchaeota archaeon]